jgi:hypothetical protein
VRRFLKSNSHAKPPSVDIIRGPVGERDVVLCQEDDKAAAIAVTAERMEVAQRELLSRGMGLLSVLRNALAGP